MKPGKIKNKNTLLLKKSTIVRYKFESVFTVFHYTQEIKKKIQCEIFYKKQVLNLFIFCMKLKDAFNLRVLILRRIFLIF